MSYNSVYERDLLYTTNSLFEPGSVHILVLDPNKKGKVPVVIESRTAHSPVKYIRDIVQVMQSDIFDRIHIDIRKNVSLFIKPDDDLSKEFGGKKYIAVVFREENIEFEGTNDIEA